MMPPLLLEDASVVEFADMGTENYCFTSPPPPPPVLLDGQSEHGSVLD